MLVGIGNNLCENQRIADLMQRYDKRFLNRIFTAGEQEYCLSRGEPVLHLAARFALKVAFFKALGVEWGLYPPLKEESLEGQSMGKKTLQPSPMVKTYLDQFKVNNIAFSIAHEKDYSVAYVILES